MGCPCTEGKIPPQCGGNVTNVTKGDGPRKGRKTCLQVAFLMALLSKVLLRYSWQE